MTVGPGTVWLAFAVCLLLILYSGSRLSHYGDLIAVRTGLGPIRSQLTWCEKEGVDRAIFTHCGSEIVAGDERKLGPKVRRLGLDRGVRARIARDGLELVLR